MDRHAYVDDFPTLDGCVVCGRGALDPIHGEPTVEILPLDALGFASIAAQLGAIAHDLGLRVPAYKARAGDDETTERAITRYPSGVVVTVPTLRSRPARDTKLDMAEGLCEANRLHHDHPKRWMILDRMELT
jgi:hypothetical protein